MKHRVTWYPTVTGAAVLILDGKPVGVATYNWRNRLWVRFRYGGQEYSYRGRDAYRHAQLALLSMLKEVKP